MATVADGFSLRKRSDKSSMMPAFDSTAKNKKKVVLMKSFSLTKYRIKKCKFVC